MLDTNILIYAIKHPFNPVAERIISCVLDGDVCISSITYGELETGILKSRNPEKNRRAVESILSGIPVLSYDTLAASCHAQIRAGLEQIGRRVEDPDMMIGGHAIAEGCTLVTNNTKHFARMNIPLEDWIGQC